MSENNKTMEFGRILADLLDCYALNGASSVYQYAILFHPEWKWVECPSCDDMTPTFDGACAVCWEDRR